MNKREKEAMLGTIAGWSMAFESSGATEAVTLASCAQDLKEKFSISDKGLFPYLCSDFTDYLSKYGLPYTEYTLEAVEEIIGCHGGFEEFWTAEIEPPGSSIYSADSSLREFSKRAEGRANALEFEDCSKP